jgi:5-methylcytosine-specific restriction endonuclease McrA
MNEDKGRLHTRIRLDPEPYRQLRQQVLERDGWRCQHCGRLEQLEIHHIRSRAQHGADSELNLITLCACCHTTLHSGTESS